MDASKTIYLFKSQRDEAEEPSAANIAAFSIAQNAASSHHSSLAALQLLPESVLRREYFLLIWSAQLRLVLLAQRSRGTALPKPSALESDAIVPGELSVDENPERKQQLMTICSLDIELLEQLLGNLGRAVVQPTETISEAESDAVPVSPKDWIAQWQQEMSAISTDAIEPRSLSYLLMKQIQKQEEIWHRSALHRKQSEQAELLHIQNEELQNAVRLKDEFINNVGQELRTPLTTIKTALTLLNSSNIKPPQRQRYMDLIAKECDRQSSLITSLLDLVQIDRMAQQMTLQAVRLSDVVPGVVSTYQPLAEEKGVMLAYTVPENLPQVACVDGWLKQIVINLLHNGIKFTPRGGQVWVRAKQQGEYVQLEFRDTGIGIPQSEVSKIFDRFYRGRQSSEEVSGAGLGLTIVQQLLLHCSGSISVKSKLGEGSTFNVLLQIYKAPSEPMI